MGKTRLSDIVTLTLWISGIVALFFQLNAFSQTAGAASDLSSSWPEHSLILRSSQKPTLILFVHPQCSCSRASISELERIQFQIQNQAQIIVVFYAPSGTEAAWVESDLWTRVQQMPGVLVRRDLDGREADIFAVKTSGQTFLFDSEGRLQFQGGITASRGHEGANPGEQAILSWFEKVASPSPSPFRVEKSNVYGCAIKKGTRSLQPEARQL